MKALRMFLGAVFDLLGSCWLYLACARKYRQNRRARTRHGRPLTAHEQALWDGIVTHYPATALDHRYHTRKREDQ